MHINLSMGVHSIYSSNKCTTERAYGSGRWCELSETFMGVREHW